MIKIKKINTVSNYLSFSRVLLAVPILYFLSQMEQAYIYRIVAFLLMIIAAVTDFLDGYFARKFNEISELGKIIDPLADKLAIGGITIYLFYLNVIPEYLFWIIIARDILIFIGGSIISAKVGKVLPSNLLGKITVCVLGVYLLAAVLGVSNIGWLNDFLIALSIIMSFLSLAGYIIRGTEVLRYKKNENV